MHETLTLLPQLAAILIGAKLAGRVSRLVGLPAVFGELLLGLALGPSLLRLVEPNAPLALLAQIGVILLMFRAGLETDLVEMKRVGFAASLIALGGVLIPLGGGFGLGLMFGLEPLEALFVGAVLTATSVSISAEVLRELGALRSRVGAAILGAAVIDDVLGVVVLSLVLGLAGAGNPWVAIGKMVLFFPIAWLLAHRLVPWVLRHEQRLGGNEAILGVLLGVVLIFSWAAEELGSVAAITGAYLLGIVVARYTDEDHVIHHGSAAVGYALAVPVFFVSIGLDANIMQLLAAPAFIGSLLVLALIGKVGGCGLGALVGGFGRAEALQVGVGMVARGEVALVMVVAGRQAGLVDNDLFAAAIVMTLVTTLVTPPLLRLAFAAPAMLRRPAPALDGRHDQAV